MPKAGRVDLLEDSALLRDAVSRFATCKEILAHDSRGGGHPSCEETLGPSMFPCCCSFGVQVADKRTPSEGLSPLARSLRWNGTEIESG